MCQLPELPIHLISTSGGRKLSKHRLYLESMRRGCTLSINLIDSMQWSTFHHGTEGNWQFRAIIHWMALKSVCAYFWWEGKPPGVPQRRCTSDKSTSRSRDTFYLENHQRGSLPYGVQHRAAPEHMKYPCHDSPWNVCRELGGKSYAT